MGSKENNPRQLLRAKECNLYSAFLVREQVGKLHLRLSYAMSWFSQQLRWNDLFALIVPLFRKAHGLGLLLA